MPERLASCLGPALVMALSALTGCATTTTAAAEGGTPAETPAATAQATNTPLAEVTLPSLPGWTDRYRSSNKGDVRFFNLGALMARYQLSRLQAVELQNHYRDLSRASADAGGPDAWFAEALARVRRGDYESGLDERALAAARFIVVFDLDETLYDQRVAAGARCADVSFTRANGRAANYLRVPGWSDAFARIRELGGAIVIFSANLDEPTRENLAHWRWEGTPLLDHDAIAGVMTNSYLTMQSTHEGPGRAKARRGTPVPRPSKDLRHVDETLQRVIIVDDNPVRLFQPGNVRVFKKLDADRLCETDDEAVKAGYRRALPQVVGEIADALRYMDQEGVGFAEAYRPHTMMGREALRFLMGANGWDEATTIAYLRQNPQLIDDHF